MMLVDVADYSKKEACMGRQGTQALEFRRATIFCKNVLPSLPYTHSVLQVRSGEWCVLVERQAADKFDRERAGMGESICGIRSNAI